MLWKESANRSMEGENSHHLILYINFYWNTETAIFWCIIFAPLCATTAKVSSCNRHSIAHKPTIFSIWIFTKKKLADTLTLKRQKSTGHCDARTMRASQGRKAGDDREEGSTEEMLWGRGGGGRCVEGDEEWHRKRCWPTRPPEREVSLRREHIPSFEIISRNLQTWVQILVCIKQFLKLLFSFEHPDGPESPERRC